MCDEFISKYIELVKEDKGKSGSYNRYPIRFVFFPFSQLYELMVTEFVKMGANTIDISNLLPKNDGWLDRNTLLNIIKNQSKEKDTILLGFTELVRFYNKNELESLILSLITDIENRNELGSRRIYVFCYGLFSFISKICSDKHNRLKIYNPILAPREALGDNGIKLFFTKHDTVDGVLDVDIPDVKSWVTLWKKPSLLGKALICTSKTLLYWYDSARPDNVFEVDKLENEKDILMKIFNFNIPMKYDNREKDFWTQLLKDIISYKISDMVQLFEKLFNVNNILSVDILKLWFSNNLRYYKWLTKVFLMCFHNQLKISEYLAIVIKSIKSYEDEEFAKQVWLIIFDIQRYDLADQRKALIKQMYNFYLDTKQISDELRQDLKGIQDITTRKSLLTGITDYEKSEIIKLFGSNDISLTELQEGYPQLFGYIKSLNQPDTPEGCDWINEYFQLYRDAKIKNQFTDKLSNYVMTVNSGSEKFYSWYYKLPSIKQLLVEEDVDSLILLDGVGAEYINLLTYLLQKKKWFIVNKVYARSELPTTTKYNKNITLKNAQTKYIQDFDKEVIHGDYYRYPDSIVKSINKIEEIINEYIKVKTGEKVAIIADHGSTISNKLSKNPKTYNFINSEHDGRCMLLEGQEVSNSKDYLTYHNSEFSEKWVVALRDISLNNKSGYESHGGATPEEVIVPVIIFSKDEEVKIKYKIKPLNIKISGLNKKVAFSINPKPKIPPILIDEKGNQYTLAENQGKWEATIKDVRKQKIYVSVGECTEVFETKTTFEEGDLF